MSIAQPYACCDQVSSLPVTRRQLKADVLFASIEASSSPRYSSTSFIRWMGKPASKSILNTPTTPRAWSSCTTSSPRWTAAVETAVGERQQPEIAGANRAPDTPGVLHSFDRRRIDRSAEQWTGVAVAAPRLPILVHRLSGLGTDSAETAVGGIASRNNARVAPPRIIALTVAPAGSRRWPPAARHPHRLRRVG